MKAQIHPTWYPEAKVTCACGNTFTIGSTLPQIHVEVCYSCHPFYTGEARFVDIRGRIDRFRDLEAKGKDKQLSKKERRQAKRLQKNQEELERPESLEELRNRDER